MNTEQLKTKEELLDKYANEIGNYKDFRGILVAYKLCMDDPNRIDWVVDKAMQDFASQESKIAVEKDRESRWISVKTPPELTEQVFWYNDDNERVPWEGKFQRHVLAVDADGRIFMARLDCNGWAEVSKNSISGLVNPTHWQPLPEPPKTVTP